MADLKKWPKAARDKHYRKSGGGGKKITKIDAAQDFKQKIESEFPSIRASVWSKNNITRVYVKDTTQRRAGAQDRGYISFESGTINTKNYRGFVAGGKFVADYKAQVANNIE